MKLPSNVWFRIDALLVLVFLAHSAWLYIETHRLEATQAAIRAKGGPVTFDELNHALAGPAGDSRHASDDACRYYRAAVALARRFPARANPFERLAGAASAPAPAEVAWVRKAVEDNQEAFNMVDEGARHESCQPRVDRPYDALGVGALLRLASLRATLRAFDGDGEGAAQALTNALRLTRGLWDRLGPLWSAFGRDTFNRDARVLLERSRPSVESLERLQSVAGLGEPHAAVVHAAETVQVWGGALDPPSSRCSFWDLALEPLRIHQEIGELQGAARVVDAVRRSWPVDRSTLESLDEGGRSFGNYRGFIVNLLRRVTQTECTLVVLSLARHRVDHGVLPATLADLPSGVRREDPLTGRPLLYRADGNRVTVYSVGGNYKDDGGALVGTFGDYDSADWGVSVELR